MDGVLLLSSYFCFFFQGDWTVACGALQGAPELQDSSIGDSGLFEGMWSVIRLDYTEQPD